MADRRRRNRIAVSLPQPDATLDPHLPIVTLRCILYSLLPDRCLGRWQVGQRVQMLAEPVAARREHAAARVAD
jgi:hypothetical protein